jgi:competence protein ComEC
VRAGVAGGTVAAVLIAWPVLGRSSAQGLEIHFLDVGQGDAVALRTPRGRWILVDAGPRSADYDAGERRVVPFFRAHGVTRLEAVVLTHPDADHIGGAAAVMRGIQVKRVIEPGVAVGKELYLEVLAEVEKRGGQWIAARSGRSLRLDGIEMRFLWPDEEVVASAVDANDASAISIVTFGEFSIVLPGDASAEVERELVDRHGPALRSSVLKAGHHGSATSTSAEFLRAVAPELVVISAGRRNRYGHPAPEVMARLKEAGVEIARTDLEGTVSLRVPADGRTPWQRIGQ